MFDKEKFRENQELKNTGYAVGFALGYFEAGCLVAMRRIHFEHTSSECMTEEEFIELLDIDEEGITIARELHAGIMAIAQGKKLLSNYCRQVLKYGYGEFVKPENLDLWADKEALKITEAIVAEYIAELGDHEEERKGDG